MITSNEINLSQQAKTMLLSLGEPYHSRGEFMDVFKKSILEKTKIKRKQFNREEILRQGLNIFENKHFSFNEILFELIENKMVIIHEVPEEYLNSRSEERREIVLSEKGSQWLDSLYTNNNSEEWQKWLESYDKTAREKRYYKHRVEFLKKSFFKGKSTNNMDLYIHPDQNWHLTGGNLIKQEIGKFSGKDYHEDSYYFHILPKLWINPEFNINKEDVSLDIYAANPCIKIPKWKIRQPYPNKGYYLAGSKSFLIGFFVSSFPQNKELENVNLKYVWTIKHIKIIHSLKIILKTDTNSYPGNIFTTTSELMAGEVSWCEPTTYFDIGELQKALDYRYRYSTRKKQIKELKRTGDNEFFIEEEIEIYPVYPEMCHSIYSWMEEFRNRSLT